MGLIEPAPAPVRLDLVWLMGLANMVYGFAYAVVLVTVPQLLAHRGVPQPVIADLTALGLFAGIVSTLLAPILDVRFSRRAYTVAMAMLAAGLAFITLTLASNLAIIAPLLFATALATSLFNSALGGWLGASLPKSADAKLGAWFNIGNGAGFGIGALVQFPLLMRLPLGWGPLAVAGLVLVPLAILPVLPAPDAGRRAMRESFGKLFGDVGQLLRDKVVLRILLLFVLPCASFALTNAFGGIGGVFHAPDTLVDGANGIGTLAATFVASLITQRILSRVTAGLLYLEIGIAGAVFTVLAVLLPHTPLVYVALVLGENLFQSATFTALNALIFRTIPEGSPLASSQFALMLNVSTLPLAYMEALDGRGFAAGGVTGEFLVDGLVSLAFCALMVVPMLRWVRRGLIEHAPDVAPPIPPS